MSTAIQGNSTGQATQTTSGLIAGDLVPSFARVGRTTAPAAGEIGENYTYSANIVLTNAATWYGSSLQTTLTSGLWMLITTLRLPVPTATPNWYAAIISNNGNNDATGALITQTEMCNFAATTIAGRQKSQLTQVVYFADSTPIYLKAYSEDVAGVTVGVTVQAVRIA